MDDKLKQLLQKSKNGTLSDQEKAILDSWYIKEASERPSPVLTAGDTQKDLETLRKFRPTAVKSVLLWKPAYWSAAAILLIGLSALFYFKGIDTISSNEIIVGGNKAQLKLSTGEVLDLSGLNTDDSVQMDGRIIYKSDEGTVTYSLSADHDQALTYDEISTPKGGEYKIVLADGTKVWLNAHSSLKFFNSLKGSSREVWLKGEAYFEVEHNKEKAFLVHTAQQDIRVLGTKFNVRSTSNYGQTTLIEGRVALRNGQVKLAPGQQLSTQDGQDLPVENVDVEPYLAWKEGYFLFNNEPLAYALEQLADWYDVEFDYKDNISGEKVWMTSSKYRDIKEVLQMIELTGTAQFTIEGRRIMVKK